MSSENPTDKSTDPREAFDENATNLEQTSKAAIEAMTAGDFAKAAELAKVAEGMKSTKGEMIDSAHDEALVEKANREAALAEVAEQDKTKSAGEAAELLEKMNGGKKENDAEANEAREANAARIKSADELVDNSMENIENISDLTERYRATLDLVSKVGDIIFSDKPRQRDEITRMLKDPELAYFEEKNQESFSLVMKKLSEFQDRMYE